MKKNLYGKLICVFQRRTMFPFPIILLQRSPETIDEKTETPNRECLEAAISGGNPWSSQVWPHHPAYTVYRRLYPGEVQPVTSWGIMGVCSERKISTNMSWGKYGCKCVNRSGKTNQHYSYHGAGGSNLRRHR